MKPASWLLAVLVVLLTLSVLPGPASLAREASAGPTGAVLCSPPNAPTPDGVIAPGEYGDNSFDPATGLLVYVACDNSTARPLHVGIISPWAGWVGLLVQASEVWDGRVNEIRVTVDPTSGAPSVLDAYGNVTAGTAEPDVSLGGTVDVGNVASHALDASRVHEFVIPLNSSDSYDSQLRSTGPYQFALEYNAYDADLQAPATGVSPFHSLTIGISGPAASWTSVELSAGLSLSAAGTADSLVALRDADGYPIPSAPVEIYVRTVFGMYDAGPVVTDDQGVADVTYAPLDNGTYVLGAAYAGADGRLASVAWRDLSVGATGSGGPIGAGLFDGSNPELRPVEALIVVIVLGVWVTYAYAFFVTWSSMRRGAPPPQDRDAYSAAWGDKK